MWLLAKLFSLEKNPSLPLFFQVLEHLKAGEKLNSVLLLGQIPELVPILRKYSHADLQRFLGKLEESVQRGYLLLYPGHELYPEQFYVMSDPPFLLRMQGSPVWLTNQGLSVVGSREPSMISKNWLDEQFGVFLERNEVFTVSGGARGVDQKIHLLSIRFGRPTVVLVPSGLSQLYPKSLYEWRQEVMDLGGALLSEYEDEAPMRKDYFHQRNRLISALGCLTLIVEARRRSGTMLTARLASEQQRPVLILPGHPYDTQFSGSLDLLRDGATAIADAHDLELIFRSEVQTLTYFQSALRSSLVSQRILYH